MFWPQSEIGRYIIVKYTQANLILMKMDYLCTVHNLTTTFYYGLVYLTDFCKRFSDVLQC